MANVKLLFSGTETSETTDHTLQVFANSNNEIYMNMDTGHYYPSFICLDRNTAILFLKELKKQISYLEKDENG